MGASDIQALLSLEEKATPAPWRTHVVDDTCIVSERCEVATTCDSANAEREDGYNVEYERMEADAAFIVALRNAFPALIKALRDAEKEADEQLEARLDLMRKNAELYDALKLARAYLSVSLGAPSWNDENPYPVIDAALARARGEE